VVPQSWRVGSTEPWWRHPAQSNGGHATSGNRQCTESGLSARFTLLISIRDIMNDIIADHELTINQLQHYISS
jgi:hypothetical protein